VDSYTAIMLARATALSLKDSIESPTGAISPEGNRETSHDTRTHILEFATTLQDILGKAVDTATATFPRKATLPPSKGTLPRQLWSNSVHTMSLKYAAGRRPPADSLGSKHNRSSPHRTNRSFWTLTQLFGAASPRLYNCVRLFHPFLGASTL
jgi:hypothetical protein